MFSFDTTYESFSGIFLVMSKNDEKVDFSLKAIFQEMFPYRRKMHFRKTCRNFCAKKPKIFCSASENDNKNTFFFQKKKFSPKCSYGHVD